MRLVTLLTALLAAAALAGCGGDDESERTFDAAGFVAAANEQDAGITLGDELETPRSEVTIHEIEFTEATEATGETSPEGEGHGGGSLSIATSTKVAMEEFSRCENAVTLICFRAANAVLIIENEADPQNLARIEAAIRGLESG